MKPIPEPLALLGADQADNRIRLFNPFAKGNRKPDLWSYPQADEPEIKFMPTDAKRVEWKGSTHILAAYHGRVRLVRFADHHLVRDVASYGSCHSAELLPDGNIVTANSNGIIRVRPAAPPRRLGTAGSKFYKARWWHPVTFSYSQPGPSQAPERSGTSEPE